MAHRWALVMMVAITTSAGSALAQTGTAPIATARLVAEKPALVPGQSVGIALVLTAPPGWHTYWRNPGNAGAATTLDWRLPDGVTAGPLRWPAPRRFVTGPIVSYGHEGETWLISTLSVPATLDVGETANVAATAEWLVCADICVPEQAQLSLTLPVAKTGTASVPSPAFTEAERRLPRPLPDAVYRIEDGQALIPIPVVTAGGTTRAWFFPYDDGVIEDGGPQRAKERGGQVVLRVPLAPAGTARPRLQGVLVTDEGAFAINATHQRQ